VDRVVGGHIATNARSADEARGAADVAVDSGDRGKSEEPFARVGEIDRLAAELKLVTERPTSGVRVPGEHRDQPGVPADHHQDRGIVERVSDRLGLVEKHLRVAIAALRQRRIDGRAEQTRELDNVAYRAGPRRGFVDELAKVGEGGRSERLCDGRHRDLPLVVRLARAAKRVVGECSSGVEVADGCFETRPPLQEA
jgi:hypothetical protein